MGRSPTASRSRRIHSGDGAIFTPFTDTAQYIGQLGVLSSTDSSSPPAGAAEYFGAYLSSGFLSCLPNFAASSRAIPIWLRQSPRFAVSSISNTVSESVKTSFIGVPISGRLSSISRPLWSCPSPSSRAEHIMPLLSTPRSFDTFISKPLPSSVGSFAPERATGTLSPTL